MRVSLHLPDERATAGAARVLVSCLPREPHGWTILLEGELGSGKSTFARSVLRALGHAGPVPSPTYTLVEPYDIGGLAVYHVDLYRIASEDELQFLGWNELDAGFRLVEWPDRAPSLAGTADIGIQLAYSGAGRQLEMEAHSAAGASALEGFPRGERVATD